jgi:negative regulator of flagellin synthesis FlgM
MNIDRPAHPTLPPVPPSGGSSAPAPAPAAQRQRPAEASAATGSVSAQLHSTNGDFDAARVAELRDSIKSGTYQVNLGRVADGLLNHLSDISPRT